MPIEIMINCFAVSVTAVFTATVTTKILLWFDHRRTAKLRKSDDEWCWNELARKRVEIEALQIEIENLKKLTVESEESW